MITPDDSSFSAAPERISARLTGILAGYTVMEKPSFPKVASFNISAASCRSVSYTHLDVYKRQALSLVFAHVPLLAGLSSGFKIILLTILIAGAAAILFPVKEENEHES